MAELRTIKGVVAGLTLLLVVMLGVAAWGLVRTTRAVLPPPATSSSATPWRTTLPAGATPVAISPAGPHLAILVNTPDGPRILFFNPTEQRWIGTLTTAP